MANEPTDALVAGEYSTYPPYDKLNTTHVQEACLNLEYDDIIDNAISNEFQHCLVDSPLLQIDINLAEDIWARSLLQNSPDSVAYPVNIDGETYEPKNVIRAYINKAKTAQNNNQGGNNNMPNVMFKRGTNADLNTKVYNFTTNTAINVQDGTFYLTTDTNRLYIGQANSTGAVKLIELNKSITTVNSVSELPTSGVAIGQFYYINGNNQHTDTSSGGENGNILAVCTHFENGVAKWTQVNPDTDVNDRLGSVSITATTANSYQLSFQIVDKNGVNKGDPITATLAIDPDNILKEGSLGASTTSTTANNVKVTHNFYGTNKTTPISTANFVIQGGTNVNVSTSSNNVITISSGIGTDSVKGAVESLTANTVKNYVTVNGAQSGDALVINADKALKMTITTATGADNKTIVTGKIEHSTTTASTTSVTAQTLSTTATFNAISGVEVDNYGHVTKVTTTPITAPNFKASSINANANGDLSFEIADGKGESTGKVTTTGVLFNTITVDGTTSTVSNQGHLGSFWSADALEAKFRSLDAFTYQGVVGNGTGENSLPSTGVHNGDAYKVSANGYSKNGITANPGDLIIATGTENNDGVLTSVEWTIVASGTETDTTYDLVAASTSTANNVKLGLLARTDNGALTNIIPVSSDGVISVTATQYDLSTTAYGSIAFSHKTSGVTANTYGMNTATTTASPATTLVIPKTTIDTYGHVTSATNQTINLQTYTLKAGVQTDSLSIVGNNGNALSSVKFESGTATAVEVSTSGIRYNHANVTATTSASTTALNIVDGTQSFSVKNITRDDQGHVSAVDTVTYNLPQIRDQLISSVTSTTTNSVSFSTELQDYNGSNVNKGDALAFSLDSTSLQITHNTQTNAVSLDLLWGTF